MGTFREMILGESTTSKGSTKEYMDLSDEDLDRDTHSGTVSYYAKVTERMDVETIKDEIYEGNQILVDLRESSHCSINQDHIEEELSAAVDQVNGDIVEFEPDMLLITPSNIGISRSSLC